MTEHLVWAGMFATWCGVVIALIASIKSNQRAKEAIEQNEKVAHNAIMAEIQDSFSRILNREIELVKLSPTDLDNEQRFNRYSTDYLNQVDRLLFIKRKKMIPDDVFDYFEYFIEFSSEHLEWKKNMYGDKIITEKWSEVDSYLKSNNIQSNSRTLPQSMQDFAKTYQSSKKLASP
jgi:hypothetical protein